MAPGAARRTKIPRSRTRALDARTGRPSSIARAAVALLVLSLSFLAWRISRPPVRAPAGPTVPPPARRVADDASASGTPGESAGGARLLEEPGARPLLPQADEGGGAERAAPTAAATSLELAEHRAMRVQVAAWMQPGLCGSRHGARAGARDALLATFVSLPDAPTTIRYDRRVSAATLEAIGKALEIAVERVRARTGLSIPPSPRIYVYADLAQLQQVSCVNRAAIGYYDGAIHLSGDARHGQRAVVETVVHEYVHHVLSALGISTPMWLQEGLAMDVAGETWFLDPSLGLVAWLQGGHLPFEAMGAAFPHASDESFALAAYCQCYAMVQFVRQRRGEVRLRELLVVLLQGQVGAAEAFSWAAGLSGAPLERAWSDAVARGELLAPRR